MKQVRIWVVLVLSLGLVSSALAQSGSEELAARQADASNPFWNPSEDNLASWQVIDGVEEGAEITFWTMSLSPTFDEYIQQIVANFEATYPGVTVNWEDVPFDGLQARVRNSFTAGNPPDVANISPAWIAEFADAGLLMDMDAAIADYPELREQYVDTAWNTGAFAGTSYQVPWYLALSNFLGYNAALLEECGLSADDLPTTWMELESFASTTLDTCGYYATSLNFGPATEQYLMDYLIYNDAVMVNDDGTVEFIEPQASEALQVWVNLIENDLIPRSSLTDDHRNMIDRFSEGETLLVMIAPHLLRLVDENNPDVYEQLEVASGITGSSGASRVDVQALVLAEETEFPNAAMALALFVTNPETQAEFSKWAGIFPSNFGAYSDPYFTSTEGGQLPQIRPLAFDYVQNADNRSITFPNDAEVQQAVTEATQLALLGQASPQEALEQLETRINDIVQQ
jgi:putative chitobiose transport system substrate-binding protein